MTVKSGPQRTCIACRQAFNKKQLIRYVVAPDGAVLVDYNQRLPGRGVYTCISLECLQSAVKRNAFQRGFKGHCHAVEMKTLVQQLLGGVEQKIKSLLGMSRKSKQFIAGSNAVIEALKKDSSLALVILANDISASIKVKIETLAQKEKIYIAHLFDKQKIGQMLGKEERSVMAIHAGFLAESLLNELHMYKQLVREN